MNPSGCTSHRRGETSKGTRSLATILLMFLMSLEASALSFVNLSLWWLRFWRQIYRPAHFSSMIEFLSTIIIELGIYLFIYIIAVLI